jgi:dimethylaniline monooxygenase (N-oxide forming)
MNQLVSSTRYTTFSDFRCSADAPDFLSATQYCAYLEAYTTQFDLWKHIRFSTCVTSVRRYREGHVVTYTQPGGFTEEWFCDAIAICSGLHVLPNIPYIKGIEHVPKVLHSSEYKQKSQFGINKNVMILGTGETGMDISLFAVKSPTKSVVLSHRDGFMCLPKASCHVLSPMCFEEDKSNLEII